MGCDIHGYVQINYIGTYWQSVIILDSLNLRDYDMFGGLFGVRTNGGLVENRGLPVRFGANDDEREIIIHHPDLHHHTWAYFEEVVDKWLAILEHSKPFNYESWLMLYEICDKLHRFYGKNKVRLVVWFDN